MKFLLDFQFFNVNLTVECVHRLLFRLSFELDSTMEVMNVLFSSQSGCALHSSSLLCYLEGFSLLSQK